jgi:hypothetical protein
MRTILIPVFCLFIVISTMVMSGCLTFVGLGIGAHHDKKKTEYLEQPISAEDLVYGLPIKVVYRDRAIVLQGRFLSVIEHDSGESMMLEMAVGGTGTQIPFETIDEIFELRAAEKQHTGKITGFLIGAVADLIIYYAAAVLFVLALAGD